LRGREEGREERRREGRRERLRLGKLSVLENDKVKQQLF
jgi:hypothetical protein